MKRLILLLLLVSLILCGCSPDQTAEDDPSPSVTEPIITEPTPTPEPVIYRAPLTGELLETDPGNNRPYAVVINNISVAMPHCGVGQADIIYEALAEGEITRMLAVFSDITDAGALGSMRSARPYFIELALSYDAIFVHAGGSEQAYHDISSLSVDNIDGVRGAYGEDIFYRDPTRQAYGYEHSLFTTGEKVLEYTHILGYERAHAQENYDYGLSFTEFPAVSGEPAQSVNISFGGLKDTYLSLNEEGLYTAKQFGKDYIDGNTGELPAFRNLLVLYADTWLVDDYGRRAMTLIGQGEGLYFVDGNMMNINWSHNSTGAPFKYSLTDGTDLLLGIGKTYIAIVPTGSTVTVQ